MSIGAPSRKSAWQLASTYNTLGRPREHEAFVQWLGSLTEEVLTNEYNISGFVLQDLQQAIRRMTINPLLSNLQPLQDMLPIQENVAGIAYDNRRQVAARRAKIDDPLDLVREPDNPVDPNAVLLRHRAGEIGYLPWYVAQLLAPEMDSGIEFASKIIAISPGGLPRVEVRLQ